MIYVTLYKSSVYLYTAYHSMSKHLYMRCGILFYLVLVFSLKIYVEHVGIFRLCIVEHVLWKVLPGFIGMTGSSPVVCCPTMLSRTRYRQATLGPY